MNRFITQINRKTKIKETHTSVLSFYTVESTAFTWRVQNFYNAFKLRVLSNSLKLAKWALLSYWKWGDFPSIFRICNPVYDYRWIKQCYRAVYHIVWNWLPCLCNAPIFHTLAKSISYFDKICYNFDHLLSCPSHHHHHDQHNIYMSFCALRSNQLSCGNCSWDP